MPTYRNTLGRTNQFRNKAFKLNEEHEVLFIIPNAAERGFVKTSDEPKYLPVIHSQTLSSGSSIELEEYLTNDTNNIRIMTDSSAKITFNDDTNEVMITAGEPIILYNPFLYSKITCTQGSTNVELWKGLEYRV